MLLFQLLSSIAGAFLVVGAFVLWRTGALKGGGLRLQRGEPLFLPLVFVLALAGLGSFGAAAWVAVRDPAPPRSEQGSRWALVLPDGWRPEEALAAALPPGARAFVTADDELVILESEVAVERSAKTVGALLAERREALALGPEAAVIAREGDGVVELLWRYDSPRGPVRARALGYIAGTQPAAMAWVTATCTHRAAPNDCDAALAAIVLRDTNRLPLDAALP